MLSDNELRDVIRSNLKELRRLSGKTQADVARYCGKTENAVGAWEQGHSLPDIVTLSKLAALYHVKIDYFYNENNQQAADKSDNSDTTKKAFAYIDGKSIEIPEAIFDNLFDKYLKKREGKL